MVHRIIWITTDAMDIAMDSLKSDNKMLRVGLTGGIGSGKTTAANLFAALGVPIIDADEIAHRIAKPNEIAYQKIIDHFGKDIITADKTIDRKKLRHIIFENNTEKKWLENCLHPLIRKIMRDEIAALHAPYCICVIPLLAESTDIDFIDRVLVIDTPIEIQIERAKQRDHATEKAIQKIMGTQATQSARLKIADDVLINDADVESLRKKVVQLHQRYLQHN